MEIIAGVDEAGRGPLAGPVYAAAVILPENHSIEGLNDSKKLSPGKREKLYTKIISSAVSVGIGIVDHREIDRINILQATYKAMQMALGKLNRQPTRALIDGYALPSQIIPNKGVIGGDGTVDCIKAASIIAKVSRDRHMLELDRLFPEYGFKNHKGYGTQQHLAALEKFRACPVHRITYKPVAVQLPTIKWLKANNRLGWWGERLAGLELMKKGYRILTTNETCSHFGEIDLIAETDNELIFVEVKTISKPQLGTPEQKIDYAKLTKLQRAIDYYCMTNDVQKDIRLDVFTVVLTKGQPRIKHLESIEMD